MIPERNPADAFASERKAMVEQQLRQRGIHDVRVLEAMRKVPRHEFVGQAAQRSAYTDEPVVIGEQQTTSQPYMIATMLQAVAIQPQDRVLEIGSGSGYQTALLAELARQVFAVERYPSLAESSRRALERLGYKNVTIAAGDGSLGMPQEEPFDAIVVSAAAPRVSPALLEQLAEGGRLVIPVGEAREQVLQLVSKQQDSIKTTSLGNCRFLPLIGEQGFVE